MENKLQSNRVLSFAFFASLLFCSGAKATDTNQLCSKLLKAKGPTAYLIDQKGELVSGPINFGRYPASADHVNEYEVAPTPYKLVIIPRQITASAEECNMCVHLKKIAPICRGANTYEIGIGLSFRKPGGIRPFKQESDVALQFEDPDSAYPPDVKFWFQPKIIGELYDPRK